MMNKMCMAAIIAASLYAGTTFAQPAAVKKIIETGQTDNRVMHQLDILTNRFGGRVIGSDAYENAAEWMMREYKRWGSTDVSCGPALLEYGALSKHARVADL